MKKAGILTINGNYNYGNRLQNYALKKTIEKYGFQVETIWFTTNKENIERLIKNTISKIIKYKRKVNFINFSNDYLNIHYYKTNKIDKNYDYIIVGSDQVWNYSFSTFDKNNMLNFSSYEKNISYAASFGVDYIPIQYKKMFEEGLNNIKYISVREEKGKEIVEELTGRKDAKVLVDPTMLLTSEEWDKISKKPSMLKTDKYILNYFLGTLSESRIKEINKIAKENNCEIINILDKNSPFYSCGPSEFLYLEKNAFLICTDSFHSSVFSIIYNTPFIVFDREDKEENMNSRIETLLNKFDLKDRKFSGKITKELLECDYTKSYKILEAEKEKSLNFLKTALDIKNEEEHNYGE